MPKVNVAEAAMYGGLGAAAGVGLITFIKIPVFIAMAVDYKCPERGAGILYGLSGIVGGTIGIIRNINNQNKRDQK